MTVQVSGLDEVMKNLNRELGKIDGDTKKGLISAARYLKLEAMSRAPEDTGNLKDTAFHKLNQKSGNYVETVGFTAPYSAAVHEKTGTMKGMPRTRKGAKGHFWDQGEPHFLTKAVVENITVIFNIIKRSAGRG